MEDEETETSVLKSELIREPDLLSDVSDMKQDLIKMTAILTADSTEKSPSLGRCGLEKGTDEVSGEPLEIMEKDLEKVKEDLEKVSEILRSGTYEGEVGEEAANATTIAEEWVLLSDSEIEEAKKMAALGVQEPILRDSKAKRGAPRPKAIKSSGDLKEYLMDAPVSAKVKTKKETGVQEKFTDILRKSAKPSTQVKSHERSITGDVKKTVRRKGKDQEQAEGSTEAGALLSVPTAPTPASPVSPVIEETPIGSIKDKVKALQQKVEAEQKSKKPTGSKPSHLPVISKSSSKAKESSKSKLPKSPKAESERLEETMSVKELMQAFQTGQDPSKRKSGLFEVKTATSRSEKATPSQSVQSKSMTKAMTSHASQGQEVLLDPKNAKKQTTLQEIYKEIKSSTHSEPSETLDFGNGGIDDSSDNCKHEGVAKSLSGSSGDHLNSEDSYKHEGLTSSGTTPERLSGLQSTKTLSSTSTKVKDLTDKDKSGDSGVGTSGDQVSAELTLCVSSSEAADDHTTSESMSVRRAEFKPTRPQNLIKRVSETVETFLSDDDSPDDQIALPLVGSPVSRSLCKYDESFDLPLKQESDALSPLADDSLTISHRDSLEGSPLIEENSSHKSPDSIEPSPTTESSPRDSLESSPVQQKSHPSFPPVCNANKSSNHTSPSKAKDLPQDAFHGRLLGDPETSADDDSCEQTSQMTSSGKSLLSPDTPSSEEVSYEVNPRLLDNAFLCISFKPAAIPEDPAEDDATYYEAKKKITPEEEMFKMATKIKTFNQMEQEPKSNRRFSKDLFFSGDGKTGDNSCETLKPSSEKLSQSECRLNRHTEDSKLAHFIGPDIKVQPPSPFSAGVHDGTQSKEVTNTSATVTPEGSHSVSDQHHSKSNLKTSWEEVPSSTEAVNRVCNTTSATSSIENRTDEQKQESLKRSSDNVDNRGHMLDVSKVQTGMQKPNCNVTDEVKEDSWGHAGAPKAGLCPGVATSQTKYEVFIYNDGEEENEASNLPRTESKGVTARVETESWSAMREDDVTFAARVKDEEQKILNLVMDRQSVQATPDTTPGRTPTEESTPTSEPNPFLFQEGKLFEMTRSGAIDMTKRSYEEEGGGFAFFQIGDQFLEEPTVNEPRQENRSAGESAIGLNLTLELKIGEDEILKDVTDSQLQSLSEGDQLGCKADTSKSKIPKMGISASTKTSKKDLVCPEPFETKTENIISEGLLDLETTEQPITNVQTAETTVTRSVYSEQGQESSDSSPEETKSVVEAHKTTGKQPLKGASQNGKKIQSTAKAQARSVPQSRAKSIIPSPSHVSPPLTAVKKETYFTLDSKSRIPIKASSAKPDSHAKRVESAQEKKLKVPVKKGTRRKSETDAGPSVDFKTKTQSSKAKSFCEGESTRSPIKKVQDCPVSVESTRSKGFQSRLPVRGKTTHSSHSTTTTKPKSKPQKQSIEFFEEISDEAAKVVARLAQAETDKDEEAVTALSDDESSLIDPSIIEREPFPDLRFPPSGDVFPIRPLWDDPVETQMQRIPDDKVQSQGIPQLQGLFSISSTSLVL